jgi:hypothetical protein
MIELRLRTRAHPDTLAQQTGRLLDDNDYGLLLTGPARVLKPDGRPLAVYLPGQLRPVLDAHPDIATVLYSLRLKTDNRGLASGSRRRTAGGQTRSRTRRVPSMIVGAVDPMGQQVYCRLTAWTGTHLPEYQTIGLLLKEMAAGFAQHVPDRHAAQAAYVERTEPEWVVPGTPYTTVTVNNTYATGVHQDAGDLEAGFSCLAVLRRGHYAGGRLVFPEWRVAVDMHHGDLLLMDAHDWHGNTRIHCPHAEEMAVRTCATCEGERVSVVAYYREKMEQCGTADAELDRATQLAVKRSRL